ncbi:MAG: DUF4932 domain-containing protein [Deltaproteobacteria bacterium]|nr:DUF4932 domain-containing protein [Deltaproteobacteria bacterium]
MRLVLVCVAIAIGCGSPAREPPAAEHSKPIALAGDAKPGDAATPRGARLEIRADRRVELFSILHRLARSPEYRQAGTTAYVTAVDVHFGPFAKHPAVLATAAMRTKGIGRDAPMSLAVHLDDGRQLGNAEALIALEPRWKGVDLEAYLAQVRDFATVTKLDAFFDEHHGLYEQAAAKLRAVVDKEDVIGWFDQLFGRRANTRYTVVVGMLTGPASFGPHAVLPDGTVDNYQILGLGAPEAPSPAPEKNEETIGLLVHEMGHSYINPMFARHRAALEPAGKALTALVAEPMRAQGYGEWPTMLNESAVRALTVLYLRDRRGPDAGAAAARAELRASFVWTNELVEVFRKLQRDRAGDVEGGMPQIIAFFDGLVKQYGGVLPKQPFIGPVNNAIQGDLAIIQPATGDPAVHRYARFIQEKLGASATLHMAEPDTLERTAGKNLLAYGNPKTNPVIAAVAEWAGWKITEDGIELGVKKFPGKRLVLIACWFRRDDPTRAVVVYASASDADIVNINAIRHGAYDWLVAQPGPRGYVVVAQGNWPMSNGAWVPPY